MQLLELPAELVSKIMMDIVLVRGFQRTLRLRLVCKAFYRYIQDALFQSRLLDDIDMVDDSPLRMRRHLSDLFIADHNEISKFWHSYLVYRVQNETGKQPQRRYLDIRLVAERVCEETGSNMMSTVEALCWPALPQVMSPNSNWQLENGPSNFGLDLLCAAAYLNHIPMAARLLQEGRSPHTNGVLFSSPMKLAAWAGNAQMLAMFQGDVPERESTEAYDWPHDWAYDWRVKTGPSSLYGAAIKGDMAMVYLAMYPPSRGAPNSIDFVGQAFGSVDNSANTSFTTNELETAQSRGTRSVEVAKFLGGFLTKFDKIKSDPNTLVFHAHLGDLEMVRHILDAGADTSGANCPHYPLVVACKRYNDDVVTLLLERGTDPNCYGDRSKISFQPPIVAAARVGSLPIVRKLISHGALLRYEDAMGKKINAGYDAIFAAVHTEHTEMVKYLVAVGVDIGGESGQELLKSAIRTGLDSMAELLQELGITLT